MLEKGILGDLTYYPSTGNPYNFGRNIFVTPIFALIVGLLIGAIEIVYLNKLFIQKSFSSKIVYKTIVYLATIISFLIIVATIANSLELQTNFFDNKVWNNTWAFISDYAFFSVAAYMAVVIVFSLFYIEVSENMGQEVLTNFFTGKYHTPRVEERIFMFLDMKSSTTIAENLGHVKYFEMLRAYYSDLSDPIVKYTGEIYQYVGDELVVSWKLKNGLQDNNCIECFFAMKAAIRKQAEKYNEKFGLLPAFKAGLHLGKVTTGEIGALKKEIIFTGDVLNTAARIQGLCNFFEVDILISDDLKQMLKSDSQFQIKSFGKTELRGRGERMELFTILSGL